MASLLTRGAPFLEQLVQAVAETGRQGNDLLIIRDQHQQIANSVIYCSAVPTSSQVFFNRDSPLRGKFPIKVLREFANDLLATNDSAHASQVRHHLLGFAIRWDVTRTRDLRLILPERP